MPVTHLVAAGFSLRPHGQRVYVVQAEACGRAVSVCTLRRLKPAATNRRGRAELSIADLPCGRRWGTLPPMEVPIRERKHHLPPESYRGRVISSFTVDTKHRTPFFEDPSIVHVAEVALEEAFAQCHGHVGVYLFVPDHVHLILSGKGPETDLLTMVAKFKQKTAFRVRQEGKAFAWQKDFYDHIIRAKEAYGAQVRYLLRNPVRAGLCAHWEHWPHKGTLGQSWQDLALNIGSL